jgi:hypothetical protein
MIMEAITINENISLGSIGTLLGGAAALIAVLRKVTVIKTKVDDTHELVNARSDRQDARVDQLTAAVVDAGASIPAPPSRGEVDPEVTP